MKRVQFGSRCATVLLGVLLVATSNCGTKTTVTVTPETVTVGVNESAYLKASSTSEYDVHFFWKSADKSVANVMGSGRGVAVWGVAPGTTTIAAEGRHSAAVGKATITVKAGSQEGAGPPATSPGASRGASAAVAPSNGTAKDTAEADYYYVAVQDLAITEGALPDDSEASTAPQTRRRPGQRRVFMQPYAVGNAHEEIYWVTEGNRWAWSLEPLGALLDASRLAIRTPAGQRPSGRLFIPKPDWSGMTYADFSVATAAPDQADARKRFLQAKADHYEWLTRRGCPGAAWFRHQANEARRALEGSARESAANTRLPVSGPGRRSGLDETYSLFSGGRAVSENLQLDRELGATGAAAEQVPLESIEGITIAEVDWQELIQGLEPEQDALATLIPADQHVLFFPSFQAMVDLADEAQARGTPVLRLLESRAEDAGTRERYERQLCLSLDSLTRLVGPKLVSSIAFTGSDPYLRTGSDVAILFETADADALETAIAARQALAASAVEGAEAVSGSAGAVEYRGVVSRDRAICSYLGSVGGAVVVTNSIAQLERIAAAANGGIPAIASLDEYTFFRDRYKCGDADETALLILTDATIRRWCGPRWRILASRRTRAAAVLSELQAKHLDALAEGNVEPGPLAPEASAPDAGTIQITSDGVTSAVYGNLTFLTPIAELPLESVTTQEAQAYERFRESYQRRWRRFFDPIAVRFSVQRAGIAVDLTVRPLTPASDYREFMDVTGSGAITRDAGDPHGEAVLHVVMSLDREAEEMRELKSFALEMTPGLEVDPLGWIGEWIAFYADEGPVWKEFEAAGAERGLDAAEDFYETHLVEAPVALEVHVGNPIKLTAFLSALRVFIEQTAPGMLTWQSIDNEGRPYVKVSPSDEGQAELARDGWQDLAAYYAATPSRFILTLNESLLERALERMASRRKAREKGEDIPEPGEPWLGKHLAVQAKKSVVAALQAMFREDVDATLEARAWGNIPILNEWRSRYPETLPVDFHQRFWQTKLVCPGGGEYLWNEEFQTVESSVYGHPGQPRARHGDVDCLFGFTEANLGLTFENDGLRARTLLRR